MLLAGWTSPLELLKAEVEALEYEGVKIPEKLREHIAQQDETDACQESTLEDIRRELLDLPVDPKFLFEQPNELAEIRALRPSVPHTVFPLPPKPELLDRLHGAWLGRCCGCALGKPVEGLGWEKIKSYLKKRGEWPLNNYFSADSSPDGVELNCLDCCRENITCMVGDDDINYTLVGLTVLEHHGPDFTWQDIAETWDNLLPYNQICTAETQALLNYHTRKQRLLCNRHPQPVTAAYTRSTNNPYREWIGAQIRADFWGWAAASNPELAAEFAWRDASWTHTRNGIYSAMFIAALEAAAFAEQDPHRLIEIGLNEIPFNCRLAAELRLTVQKVDELGEFEAYMRWHTDHFAGMSPVHTVNNACLVVMALLLGEGAPDRSMCLAVSAGLDTDCNGATVGAILGILTGAKRFGGILAPRLNDTLKAGIVGFHNDSLTSLAHRSLSLHFPKRKAACRTDS